MARWWQRGICVFLVIMAIFGWGQVVAGMDIYGDLSTNLSYNQQNEEFVGPPLDGDLGSYLGGNLYFSHLDWQLYYFLLDLRLEGRLTDRRLGEEELVAPIGLKVNQLFLQAPLSDYSFLYCGKKLKETGNSRFFNVSNRISPKYKTGFDYQRNAPGFVEVNFIPSDSFAHGLTLYFTEAQNWDEISAAAYGDYSYGNFSGNGCLYFEEMKDLHLGVNLSYQRGIYQYYSELILKNKAEQKVAKENSGIPLKDFELKKANHSLAIVIGVALTKDERSFILEYLHRQEGYNPQEQKDFFAYLDKHKLEGVPYARYAFLPNYLAFSWSKGSFISPDFTVGLSGIFSFQTVGEEFSKYASYELFGSIKRMLSQNCGLALQGRYTGGGRHGEFNRLSQDQYAYALVLDYMF